MIRKKILSIFLFVATLFGIFAFVNPTKVNAATDGTLSHPKTEGVYYTRRGGGKPYMSAQYEQYTMNGKVVYCIEPGVDITTTAYLGYDGFQASPYDSATNKKIELIGHYGYDYPGHQTLRYRMAAQALIWETTGGQIIEFWTERYGYGDYINIDYEKNQIMNLVNAHYNKPSFNGKNMEVIIGQEYKITDTNGLLSEYEVYSSSNMNVRIEGNDVFVTPLATGNLALNVVRKHYDNYTTIVYTGNSTTTQKMGFFRFSDPVVATVNLNVLGGKIQITKIDSENGTTTPQGQASLKGAKYNVINSSGNVVDTITIGNDNKAITTHLPLGTYTLKEIESPKGYYLNNNVYTATITSGDTISLNVEDKVIKNYISILKQYDYVNGNTTFLNAEADIIFEIFYQNGTKYGEVKTDSNGYATLNLPYGVWKFHQVNSNTGFEKIYDFYITVDENSELEQYYNILNNKISAYLKVLKKDSETNRTIAIANAKFKILNTDKNQYVSQYVGGKVYDNFLTDETGTFTTYLKLEAGNYKLVEIESPKGYTISDDGLNFTIGDETEYNFTTYGAVVVVEFKNSPIKGQVEINKSGEKFIVEDGTFKYCKILLKGIKYNLYADEDIKSPDGNYLYYNKGDLIETIATDNDGNAKSRKLPLGKYYLVEVETKDNYVLDTEEYHFELTEKDNRTAVVHHTYKPLNKLKKGTLEFTKKDLVNGDVIPNTLIEVYTENDELIFNGKTDKNGKVIIEELRYGKYYIIEKESATGYVITNEKVLFEIKENGEIVKAEMTNRPVYGTLEFTKTDISTSEPLPNTVIEIYNENDELVFSGKTDENGKIIIEELRYGKYYILEKEAPQGYILTEEKMAFEILEDGEIVKANMVNEKVVVEVPNTGMNYYFVLEIISGLLVLSGIGVIIYAKKKNK